MGAITRFEITDDLIRVAVTAAAIAYGDDPATVLRSTAKAGRERRARAPAASAMARETLGSVNDIAPMFGISRVVVFDRHKGARPEFLKAESAAREAIAWARKGAVVGPACGLVAVSPAPVATPSARPARRVRPPHLADIPAPAPVIHTARRSWPAGAGDQVKRRHIRDGVEIRRIPPPSADVIRWAAPAYRRRPEALGEIARMFNIDPDALRAGLIAAGVIGGAA